jgi:methylated-DNA-[protein]-cysteine S-methyltransferase
MTKRTESRSFTQGRIATPIGQMLVVTDTEGAVRALDWEDHEDRMLRLLRLHYGAQAPALTRGHSPSSVRAALLAYLAGELSAIDAVPVATAGTPFQREVWAALRRIPAGRIASYGQLAVQIGRPAAVRAVGLANGSNPVGVIVPCHRVIGANGSLTGYGGGVERKRWLLAHEGGSFAGAHASSVSSRTSVHSAARWIQ